MRSAVGLLLLLLALALAGWQYRLRHGVGSLGEVEALHATVVAQRRENARLKQRNTALAAEVEDLKSGSAAVEERARFELGMIKPNEVFYRVVEETAVSEEANK